MVVWCHRLTLCCLWVGLCVTLVCWSPGWGPCLVAAAAVAPNPSSTNGLRRLSVEQVDLFSALAPSLPSPQWLHTGVDGDTVFGGQRLGDDDAVVLVETASSIRSRHSRSRGRSNHQRSLLPDSTSSSSSRAPRATTVCAAAAAATAAGDRASHVDCQPATHFVTPPRFAALRRSLETCAPSAHHHVGANSLGPPVHIDLGSGRVATVRVPCAGDSQLSAADATLVRDAAQQLMADHPGAKCGCVVQATVSPPKLKCQCTGAPSRLSRVPVPVPTVGFAGPNADLRGRESHLDASLEAFHRRQLSAISVADGQSSVTSQGIYADHAAVATVQRFSRQPSVELEQLLEPALPSQTTASPAGAAGTRTTSTGPAAPAAPASSRTASPSLSLRGSPDTPPAARQASTVLPSAVDETTRVAVSAVQTALPRLQNAADRRLWLVAEVAGTIKVLHQYDHLLQRSASVSSSGLSADHVHEASDPVQARIFGSTRKDLDRLRRDLALGSTRISTLVTSEGLDATRSALAPSLRTRAGVGSAMCALYPRCLSLLGGTSLQQWVLTALQQHASHAVPTPGLCADTGTEAAAAADAMSGEARAGASTSTSAGAAAAGGGPPSASSEGAASGGDLLSGLSGTGDWGLDSLLGLRRWCASPYPALWLNYASVSLSKQLPGGGMSFLQQTSSTGTRSAHRRSSGPPSATVHESALQDTLHTLARQGLTDGGGSAHIVIREVPGGGGGGGEGPPSFAAPPGVSLTPDTVRSLLVRLEGTFSCLCLNAGVPAVGLGGAGGDGARGNDTETLRTIKGFASVAGHTLRLPPTSDEQVREWVRRRLQESGGEDAAEVARLKAMFETLQKGASAGEVSGIVQQFRSEAQQLGAERRRLEQLLAARLRQLHSHLKKQADALKDAVKRSSMALVAAQKNREATVASARKHRSADLDQITRVRRLLREMGGVKTASANVQGCEGGGGAQGATLAENHAAALVALAKAQVNLDKADTGTDDAAKRRKHYEGEVRTQYLTALTAAVAYEAATQKCVAQRNGEAAAAAKGEEASAWDKAKPDPLLADKSKFPIPADSMSPLDLVAKGDLAGALDAAKSAEKRLSAAKAALESERRRWEEAVVRLARPKTCLQLLSLATEGSDGVYTVFPPDDVQYRGVQVYCDMTTDGGGWTLVGYGEEAVLGSSLGVSHGAFAPGGRRRGSANVNALWIVQASSEVALSWSLAPDAAPKHRPAQPNSTLSSYQYAVKYGIPAPSTTTLAVLPAPPPQPCAAASSSSSDWSVVKPKCIVGGGDGDGDGDGNGNNGCGLPDKMYTATDSLGVCRGHAYGLVAGGQPAKACDGRLPTSDDDSATRGAVKAGLMFAVDETEGCKGVLTSGSKQRVVPAHMAVWMR